MIQLDGNAAIAVTADRGELERQAYALVRSIERIAPNAELITFIPERSRGDVSSEAMRRYEAAGEVVWGEVPIPEYPISALIQAFVEAERVSDREYLIALDTDTLVLDTLAVSKGGSVWVRPADVGAQYWCSEDARTDWKKLTDRFGLSDVPGFNSTTACVDKTQIPPYWNSGVVVTTDRSLPERWLTYTKALFYEDDLPVAQTEFFIDQLSLSLATWENDLVELPEQMNFPLGGRLLVPEDVAILHYGDRRNLNRIPPGSVRKRVKQFGDLEDVDLPSLVRSLLDIASTHSGRVVTYKQKQKIRQVLSKLLPASVTER